MVESTEIDYSSCRLPSDPAFVSMGEVVKASQKYMEDRYDPKAIDILQSYREFRSCCMETSLKLLQQFNLPERTLISARLKRMGSIYRKLQRREKSTFKSMNDVVGFRVIFQSFADLRSVIAVVKEREGIKIWDYLEEEHPNEHGYRGSHVVFHFAQPLNEEKKITVRFEVQLRTYYQHCWACWCEGMGEQAKEGYPNRKDEPEIIEKINALKGISDRIKKWEENNPSGEQGIEGATFPVSRDITQKFAVVRKNREIDSCADITEAFDLLMDYEEQELDVLLLLGLSDDNIKKHLQETHINFLLGRAYPPEVWMPPDM